MIVVDDNTTFVKHLFSHFGKDGINIRRKSNIKELALSVKEEIQSINQHILINLEGCFESDYRTQFQGADLLVWLRCAHRISNPIILYGFYSIEHILRQRVQKLAILSEGCYYINLPNNFSLLQDKELQGITDFDNLKLFLSPAFQIDNFRHRFANKWGVNRLLLAHQTIQNTTQSNKDLFSTSLEEVVAKFLYIDTLKENVSSGLLRSSNSQANYYQSTLKDKKILYIDDQANEGWEDILIKVLGIEKNQLMVHSKIDEFLSREFYHIDSEYLSPYQPDCLLMDLRLIPHIDDNVVKETNYTGAQLSKWVKRKFPSLPVIMFSATNKAENLRVALQSGCEALWTKEGIDDYQGLEFSVRNYTNLLKLISKSCNKFKGEDERVNYEADLLIAGLERRLHAANFQYLANKFPDIRFLESIDLIVMDTSFLLETNLTYTASHISNFYLILYFARHIFQQKAIILDDVLLEILRHSKKFDYNDAPHLINRARYILFKIYDWNQEGLILFSFPDTKNYARKLRGNENNKVSVTEDSKDTTEDFRAESLFVTWLNQLTQKLTDSSTNNKDLTKENASQENSHILHADDTLVKYIEKNINRGKNILFLCDDKACSARAGERVLKISGTEIVLKDDFVDDKIQNNTTIPLEIKNNREELIYKRMNSIEFNKLLEQVKEKVLELKVV